MRVRNTSDLTFEEIEQFAEFETDTLHRMMDWAEEKHIDKDELLRTFIIGYIHISETIKFQH